MICVVYKNTWTGFLNAIFEAFLIKHECCLMKNDVNSITLYETIQASEDSAKAKRVETGMKRLGKDVPLICYRAWLSEKPGIDDAIRASLKLGFEINTDPFPLLQYPEIKACVLASRHVGMEAHRFLGLTRLKRVTGDLFAADFTHDYNLLPLMGGHFAARFSDQRIIIRDIERRIALVTGNGRWELRELEGEITPLPPDCDYERMWRRYFEAIANPARKNLRLQMKFVPLKYRAHLTEFQ